MIVSQVMESFIQWFPENHSKFIINSIVIHCVMIYDMELTLLTYLRSVHPVAKKYPVVRIILYVLLILQ